jgi:hypothetical protein
MYFLSFTLIRIKRLEAEKKEPAEGFPTAVAEFEPSTYCLRDSRSARLSYAGAYRGPGFPPFLNIG